MSDEQEVKIEETGGEGGAALDCAEKLAKLKERLKTCERERGEYLDGWQRSKADYVNYKREVAQREADLQTRLSQKIVKDLLPVLESIDHARAWIKDLGPIEQQLESVMQKYGLEKLGEIGEVFDPSRHEAVENVKVDEPVKENKIVELVAAGYSLGGQVIKPAKVKVGNLIKNT